MYKYLSALHLNKTNADWLQENLSDKELLQSFVAKDTEL